MKAARMFLRHDLGRSPLALLATFGVVSAALALAGCGQTGPLYLPDDQGEVIIREAAPQQPNAPTSQQPIPTTPQPDISVFRSIG